MMRRARKQFYKELFLTPRWYAGMGVAIALFFVAFFVPWLLVPASISAITLGFLTVIDLALLFQRGSLLRAGRVIPARLSLGDENKLALSLQSSASFALHVQIIDELPVQMQDRKFLKKVTLPPRGASEVAYSLRPTSRGVYDFGQVLGYLRTPLGLAERKMVLSESASVKVYPSFLQLRRYSLLATSERALPGVKKVRRLGHSMEFEKIKEYVRGDDVRTINWKATARHGGNLMVNTFTDARQQQVYCLVDKGRAMKMPFGGMTLLDYAINASLALLNIALLRHDRAGLITFAEKVHDIVPADRSGSQMAGIMETLYAQQTSFRESDYEALELMARRRLTQRSFLLLFTNFETLSSLERQLPHLRRMAARHLLCVVFFQNTLLRELRDKQPETTEGIYIRTIADRADFEKRQIVKELRRHGILSILTTPQGLTVDVINEYLELKARQMV
jgi:uncharacterized protein (DUF58 family)